ncbi:MAG TPA: hypothetical protein VG325_19960 [Solirubrobacteraceae bacterium]|jgi:hypothetical protein|nr:hypothetical protein [Solirubrobacteraceae bacterium]
MEVMDALGISTLIFGNGESVMDGDPLDHQHAILGFDLADRFYLKPLTLDVDLTRFQRAGEGAGQSAAGRGDHVVKRGGVWRKLLRGYAVVLGDL